MLPENKEAVNQIIHIGTKRYALAPINQVVWQIIHDEPEDEQSWLIQCKSQRKSFWCKQNGDLRAIKFDG